MIQSSELILNPDGSVYHLNLKPENIAHDIIFCKIVWKKSPIFSMRLNFSTQKRELKPKTEFLKANALP
jgi:uridine phosphorylase